MRQDFLRKLEGNFKIGFGTIFRYGIFGFNFNLEGEMMHYLIKGSTIVFLCLRFSSCTIFRPDLISNLSPVEEIIMAEIEKESKLKFDIQTDSTVHRNGEPIFLKMSITNKSDSSIFINKRFITNSPEVPKESGSGEVYLIITSSIGDTLSFNAFVHVSYPYPNDYVQLSPGE